MANLTENDQYDSGVYQWETTDSALGGPTGVMNTPVKSLVNRTRFLLNRIMDGVLQFVTDSGTKNTFVASFPQPVPALQDGMRVTFRVGVTPDGACTLKLTNTGGPVLPTLPVYGGDNANLSGGELSAGSIVGARLNTALNAANGGAWVIESVTGGFARVPTPAAGDMTTKVANMAALFAATDGRQTVDVTPAGDTVLSQAQYGVAMLTITGTLPASKNLIFPAQSGQWIVENDATGSYNLTAKTAAGTGVVLPVGVPVIVCCDGTNVKFASAGGQASMKPYHFSGIAGNSVTITGGYTPGAIIVERNGALQEPGTAASPDFTATDGTTVNFTTALTADEYVTVWVFATFSVANAVQKSGDAMGGPLALYVGSTMPNLTPLSNGQQIANAAFVNSVGPVVGASRNARMTIAAASATATYQADELIVETALGGAPIRLANVNLSVNLGTAGAGGMDTGTVPLNGYVALYAIYNPTTGTSALLARNATGAVQPNVYGGANMPSGYTASALVSVWATNGSGQFKVGIQRDRKVSFPIATLLTTSTVANTPTALNISAVVPPNAVSIAGEIAASSSAGSSSTLAFLFSDANMSGQVAVYSGASAGALIVTNYEVDLLTPQTVYYEATNTAGTPSFGYYASSYKF